MSVGLLIGNIQAANKIVATLNPDEVAAAGTDEQTFTVPGLRTTDGVYVVKPTHTAGIGIVNAKVSAANTLALTFVNATASGVNPPSEEYTIHVFSTDGRNNMTTPER